jgi:hypothetical protein
LDVLISDLDGDFEVSELPDAGEDLLGITAEAVEVLDDDDISAAGLHELDHALIFGAVIAAPGEHVNESLDESVV